MRTNSELGLRIRRIRTERGMSQAELATMLGYTDRSSIAKIEAGKTDMSPEKIKETARILGTTEAYLTGNLEDTLKTMNVSVVHHVGGDIQVYDTVRGVHVTYTPSDWRQLEELDDFRTVWSDLGGFAPETKNAIGFIKADRKRSFTEMFVKDEFKGAHVNAETHLRDNVITGKLIPTGTGLHVYTKEKLAPVTEDKPSEIQRLFDQLSPAKQNELIQLCHFYLAQQHKSEETP